MPSCTVPRVPSHNITTCPSLCLRKIKTADSSRPGCGVNEKNSGPERLWPPTLFFSEHTQHTHRCSRSRSHAAAAALLLLSSPAASLPQRFAVMPCTRAPQQLTNGSPFGVTNKLTCGQRCTQQTVHRLFFCDLQVPAGFFLSSSALNMRVLSVILPVLDSLKRP